MTKLYIISNLQPDALSKYKELSNLLFQIVQEIDSKSGLHMQEIYGGKNLCELKRWEPLEARTVRLPGKSDPE